MYNVVVYDSNSWPVKAYAHSLCVRALAARTKLAKDTANVRTISNTLIAHHQGLTRELADTRQRIRLLERGTPATEALDAFQQENGLSDLPSDAEVFLLKKAYRKAANLCHPDKGGNALEFQLVTAAYKARDIHSLNAFFLARQKSKAELIDYWLLDIQRTKVAWVAFQATNEFMLAKMYQQGRTEEAIHLTGLILREACASAMQREFFLLRKGNHESS